MLVSDFDYHLPDENIAKYPPKVRGTSRLLVLNRQTGAITDSKYQNLADFLDPGDLLILNDTRVMPARLDTTLPDGRHRELIVLEKHNSDLNTVLYRGKLHVGDHLTVLSQATPEEDPQKTSPTLIISELLGNGTAKVSSDRPLAEIVEAYGSVPLPPYLHRHATTEDKQRYQTVWAKQTGSAAAPTASLNMTEKTLEKLRQKGIETATLTLHVGLGTFLPIRTENLEDHKMHSEYFQIPPETIEKIQATRKNHHRIVALGTTVARTLEYYAKTGQTSGEDDIFIYPGFNFQLVDALLTNFHAPKSTVLMLASAFATWENLKPAYDHAIKNHYQLLSYGDSMLII
ncbi:tRNA preQ1(34) S-adenosylmethionine ribosyltransferase-isomerase QueA [Candidatus Saccharibacteria bacterium]|nr:tRNA preQ1(34) S-adenosylmethionine ribosyltransferase-isomerase QueA [Candidatus Saccharibacteria bacterium]